MVFKRAVFLFAVLFGLWGLVGCTGGYTSLEGEDNHNIGNITKSVAPLQATEDGEAQSLVMFDKVVRRIHQFDLLTMKHIRSFAVRNPGEDHHVLYGNNGNYIIDLSLKGLSIFDEFDRAHHQPLRLQGAPKSAAFLPSKGLLVVYDDLMSVGLLKLGDSGEVLNKWLAGPVVAQGASISAGDLNADGKMILGLNNGSLVMVEDLEACMREKSWGSPTLLLSGLGNIKWIAPLRAQSHQVLVRTESQLLLVDIDQKSQIASYNLSGTVLKLSKYEDPHVVMESEGKIKLLFVANSQIQERVYIPHVKVFEIYSLLSSRLDLEKEAWSFVDTKESVQFLFNDPDLTQKQRRFVRYRLNEGGVATHNEPVADNTQIELAYDYLFALYPSELGYAVRHNLMDGAKSELKFFNLKYIPAD